MTRKVKDAQDISTNELIYFKGHAMATYMSDGNTVEQTIKALQSNSGGEIKPEDLAYLATKEELATKQDVITDLDTIRDNASKGATALQSIPSQYVTESELNDKGYATTEQVNAKADVTYVDDAIASAIELAITITLNTVV